MQVTLRSTSHIFHLHSPYRYSSFIHPSTVTKYHHLIFLWGKNKHCDYMMYLHAKMILLSVVFIITGFCLWGNGFWRALFTAAWWEGLAPGRHICWPLGDPHIWCIWMKLNRVNVGCPPYYFEPSHVSPLCSAHPVYRCRSNWFHILSDVSMNREHCIFWYLPFQTLIIFMPSSTLLFL